MMRPALLLLSTTIAPAAALAADATLAFQLAADPANMTACLALGPSFDRPFTVTMSGDVVELISPGGIRSRMDSVGQDVYHTAFDLSGERLDYTADLGATKSLSVRGNNLGCKWSAKSQ
jgi:hypothetical protein